MNKSTHYLPFIIAKTESTSSLFSNRCIKMSVTITLNRIQHGKYTPRPKLHKKVFYKVFSPKVFKLSPIESINLDLQFNIKSSGEKPTDFQLFPTLARFGLSIEESNWKTATQTETITVNILNKNYNIRIQHQKR